MGLHEEGGSRLKIITQLPSPSCVYQGISIQLMWTSIGRNHAIIERVMPSYAMFSFPYHSNSYQRLKLFLSGYVSVF